MTGSPKLPTDISLKTFHTTDRSWSDAQWLGAWLLLQRTWVWFPLGGSQPSIIPALLACRHQAHR